VFGFVVPVRCSSCGWRGELVAFGVRSRSLVICPSCGRRGFVPCALVRAGRPFVRAPRPRFPRLSLRESWVGHPVEDASEGLLSLCGFAPWQLALWESRLSPNLCAGRC